MREDEIPGDGVETLRISKIFADGVIGKMAGTAKHALLYHPGIRSNFQHIEIVVGFENETVCPAQMNFDMIREIAEIGANRYLGAVRAKRKRDGVDSIVRNAEGMDVDVANREALSGLDGLHAA